MRKLSFETPDIMDILNHQVIHMDQAVTYCPEYLVTGSDYQGGLYWRVGR